MYTQFYGILISFKYRDRQTSFSRTLYTIVFAVQTKHPTSATEPTVESGYRVTYFLMSLCILLHGSVAITSTHVLIYCVIIADLGKDSYLYLPELK